MKRYYHIIKTKHTTQPTLNRSSMSLMINRLKDSYHSHLHRHFILPLCLKPSPPTLHLVLFQTTYLLNHENDCLIYCFPIDKYRRKTRFDWLREKNKVEDLSRMVSLSRVLAVSYTIKPSIPCNTCSLSSRFPQTKPKLNSKWRSMATEPDSSSFAPSIDSDSSADKVTAGYFFFFFFSFLCL